MVAYCTAVREAVTQAFLRLANFYRRSSEHGMRDWNASSRATFPQPVLLATSALCPPCLLFYSAYSAHYTPRCHQASVQGGGPGISTLEHGAWAESAPMPWNPGEGYKSRTIAWKLDTVLNDSEQMGTVVLPEKGVVNMSSALPGTKSRPWTERLGLMSS